MNKMRAILAIILLSSPFTTEQSGKILTSTLYPYIFKFELTFSDTTITHFLVESVYSARSSKFDASLHCNVSLYDVLTAIPAKAATTDAWTAAITALNVTMDDDDINTFLSTLDYTDLKDMGFRMDTFYANAVRKYFSNSTENLIKTMTTLGIYKDFTYAYAFGVEEDLFSAFRQGNFSLENLATTASLLGSTATYKDIFDLLTVKCIDKDSAKKFANADLFAYLEKKGMVKKNLEMFFDAFNLTVSSYERSSAFSDCRNAWAGDRALAVAVSNNTLITNSNSLLSTYLRLQNYTILQVHNAQKYAIEAQKIDNSNSIASIRVEADLHTHVNRTETYDDLERKNCTYVSYNGDELVALNTTARIVSGKVVISKVNGTRFTVGSPLLCDGKLYGLAAVNDSNSIGFDTFVPIKNGETSTPDFNFIDAILGFFSNIFRLFSFS